MTSRPASGASSTSPIADANLRNTGPPSRPQTKRRNHEDRVADKDIKYRPNVANICPRPKDWKPGKYQSKGVDGVDVNYPRIDERNRKYWGSAGGSHAKTFPSDE